MKRLFSVLAITLMVFFVTVTYAADEKTETLETSKTKHAMHSGKQNDTHMPMECPMMKSVSDIKLIMRQMLDLQRRSLKASASEKTKINEEITGLIKQIDAMPEKMDCPMMKQKQNDSSNKITEPKEQTSKDAKPSEHKH